MSMLSLLSKVITKDRLGAVLTLIGGAAVAAAGWSYHIGSLREMGAGFMPLALGFVLWLVGLALLMKEPAPSSSDDVRAVSVDLRAALCIFSSVGAFIVLGRFLGLVCASLGCVFLAALGDRSNTVRAALYLAIAATFVAVGVFHYGLHLQLPLFGES